MRFSQIRFHRIYDVKYSGLQVVTSWTFGLDSMNGNTSSHNDDSRLVHQTLTRLTKGTKLCHLFNRIVSQVYTIDAAHSPENRITGILAPTADRILEMFLSQDDDIGRPLRHYFMLVMSPKKFLELTTMAWNDNSLLKLRSGVSRP